MGDPSRRHDGEHGRFVAGGVQRDLPSVTTAEAGPTGVRARLAAQAESRPLDSHSLGFRLLVGEGWTPGRGLGAGEQGCIEPVTQFKKADRRGVGGENGASLALVGGENAQRLAAEAARAHSLAARAAQAQSAAQSAQDKALAAQAVRRSFVHS